MAKQQQICLLHQFNAFDNIHPSDERKESIEMFAKTLFKDKENAEALAEAYYDAIKIGEVKAVVEGVQGTVDAIVNLDKTVATLANVIQNPKETFDKVVISAEQWNEQLNWALENDPMLAAKMQGYMLSLGKSLEMPSILLTGEAAKVLQTVVKRNTTAVNYGVKSTTAPVNYPNQTTNLSLSGAENAINAVKLKEQLSNEVLKSQGTKFDELLVSARAEIDGKVYIDTNQNARAPMLADPNKPTLIAENIANKAPAKNGATYPNANMAEAHAEIGAIQQAYEKGVTKGKDMVIHVQGRDVCTYCRNDIATAAKKAGLKSVTVHAVNKDGKPVIYDWNETMGSIKLRKE